MLLKKAMVKISRIATALFILENKQLFETSENFSSLFLLYETEFENSLTVTRLDRNNSQRGTVADEPRR